MKMTQKLFERFEAAINRTVRDYGPAPIEAHRQNVPFVGDQFTAFCWSVYKVANKREGFALTDAAYSEGLNDSHMLTAIKKILADYKEA
jgi:hypothetical protein